MWPTANHSEDPENLSIVNRQSGNRQSAMAETSAIANGNGQGVMEMGKG
jgi:hypothetical protein